MNGEDVTQGTRYFNALREVADAARRVEHLRVQYENTLDQLTREKRLAEKELREALAAATELTGEPLPISQREQEEQRVQEMLRSLNGKGGKK